MIRRAVALISLVLVALLPACESEGFFGSDPSAPSLPPAFGARVTDGELRIWTGSRCLGVTRLTLYFAPPRTQLVLSAPPDRPAEVDYLTLGGPYPGLQVAEPLPEDFDWRAATSVRISVDGGNAQWGTTTHLAEVLKGSPEHPADTYWFERVGWLNPAEVTEQDGKTFLATCTEDPD